MKYSILGFQQEKLLEQGLNSNDAITLRTIKDMISSPAMEKYEDYTWIKLDYLVEQIPIVGNKRTVQSRLCYYEEIEIIEKNIIHSFHGSKGNFHMIKLLPKFDLLDDYDHVQNLHLPTRKSCTYHMQKLHDKDSSLKDSSLKDIKVLTSFEQIVEDYNKICISMPRVIHLSDKRIKSIKTLQKNIEYIDFNMLFNRASESDFLSGKASEWICNFDWLMNTTNAIKVLEGNYAKVGGNYAKNRQGNGKGAQSTVGEGRTDKTLSQQSEEFIRANSKSIEPVEYNY